MQELDVVTLLEDAPEYSLHKGERGTVVFVSETANTYLVEFLQGEENPVIATLKDSQIRVLPSEYAA